MKATKLPSGNYRARVQKTINGEKICKSFIASTKAKAEEKAKKWKTHIEMLGDDSSSLSVKQAISDYIEVKRNVLSASTIFGYENYLKNGFEDLKDYRLIDLTNPILQKSINDKATTKSVKTLKNYYGLLFSTIRMFYPEFIVRVTFPQKKKAEQYHFTKSYIKSLITAVKGSQMEIPVLLAMCLSCRASEVCGLKWSDVNFENHTLHIQRAMVKGSQGYVLQEKNKNLSSNRIAYIPDILYNALLQADKSTEFIVNIPTNQFYRRLWRLTNKAGLERISFHQLRHITASVMLDIGINNKVAQEIGGWSTDNIMKSVYQHTFTEARQSANSAINDYFNTLN